MNWLALIVAGLFEVVWAIGLKYTEGFTRWLPSTLTLGAMAVSLYLLSVALRTLPIGTAYAVWVGIGAVGTAIAGTLLFDEAATPLKIVSLVLVVAGIVGLKLASTA
jgi:quaternary ammonium compound-resistance protein SugE